MKTKTRLIAAWSAALISLITAPAWSTNESSEVIVEWNQLLQANMPAVPNPLIPRQYAMLHIAMFDAANAIERQYTPYRARLFAHPAASAEAAAAQAAHDVLTTLNPAAQATFDSALQARLAKIQPWRAAAGAAVGRKAASEIIAWRANDGSATPAAPWSLPPLPGLWQPTSAQGAQLANFGEFEPFALLTSTQYLPDPPPTLTSELYGADFEEVRQLGSATSTVRTAEQTETARLFASVGNSTSHFAAWNNVARDVSRQAHWSLIDTARLFVLLNVSIQDGVQTSHASKFIYGLWRPVTAIRRADEDLNAATIAEPRGRRCLRRPRTRRTRVTRPAWPPVPRARWPAYSAGMSFRSPSPGSARVAIRMSLANMGCSQSSRSSRRAAACTVAFISTSSSRQARRVA